MSKLIYLEPDEEITDVIDKISKVDEKSVSLVVPRGSTLANSVVNLKLLGKSGKKLGKGVALVTNDKIAKNLASQIGLTVFASISDAKAGVEVEEPAPQRPEPADKIETAKKEIGEVDGVKVHQYDKEGQEVVDALPAEEVAETEEIAAAVEDPGEVIEAVKDADVEEIEPISENTESPVVHHEAPAKDDFKLDRKPMRHEPKYDVRPHGGGDTVFDKMRYAKTRRKKIFLGIVYGLAALMVLGFVLVLPKAKALVSVVAEPFSATTDISVSKDTVGIDGVNLTIQGNVVSKEDELSKPFAASGQKNIGAKATGKITVYNNWDQNPISLPAGTTLSGPSGVAFVTTAAVTVPGAQVGLSGGQFVITASGTADVNISATEVGDKSNVPAGDFTITSIPKIQQSKIYGKSSAATSGGSNKMVKVITDADISAAKDSTEKELKGKILDAIKAELPTTDKLLDSATTVSIVSQNTSHKSGDQVDEFTYLVKMKVDAVTFSEDNFRTLLLQNAETKLPTDKAIVSNDNQDIKYEVTSADIAKGKVSLKGTFNGYIAGKYNTDELKNEIKGKTINTATKKLTSHTGVLSADVSTTPNVFHFIPFIKSRIDIEFNFGQAASEAPKTEGSQ